MLNRNTTQEDAAQKTYAQYCEKAVQSHIDPWCYSFPGASLQEMNTHRERNARLCFYWKRNVHILLSKSPDTPAVFALFDKDGYMLGFEGTPSSLQRLNELEVYADTIWKFDRLGPNAITAGLHERKPAATHGEENFNIILKRCALYFAPLTLNRETPPYDTLELGGVALFLPESEAHADYMLLANSISHDLLLNLQFSQITNMVYERISEGVIAADTKIHKVPTITHCSSSVFDIFGIPQTEQLDFHPITELIDPRPYNAEIWDILEKQLRVNKRRIQVRTRGHETSCIISTDLYNQEALNTSGINFFITTDKRITAQVSSKIGNNALLSFDDIIGESPAFQSVLEKARMLTVTQSNILLQGESGVGKDVFAQALHNAGDRSNKPFIAVNCGALPRELIASELFGYDGGAFTGAKRQGNIGKFELANGGTIFLDEIGELPLDLQATLLRAVEQKRFMRLGSSKEIDIDVKIISATNADIPEMIREKKFRSDLYYRLSTMQLFIPPLRDHGNDIILLSEYFIRRISQRICRTSPIFLSPEAKQQLLSLPWQGNVRELQNVVERIVQLYPESTITPAHILDNISPEYRHPMPAAPKPAPDPAAPEPKPGLLTKEEIREALFDCHGNRSEAAKQLGIARRTLYRNMERLGMEVKKF